MFQSLFSILKSSRQEAASQQHHLGGMTKQKFSSPPSPVTGRVIDQQPSAPDQMQQLQLRGGGEGADICCGVCTGLLCFECCTCCLFVLGNDICMDLTTEGVLQRDSVKPNIFDNILAQFHFNTF
ncbi:hypothetical protein VN97_g4351 [Penicillium thymicola]|uniref:Uncharacterized protein n=1 Tax=Penicillium thymicola TaxID=293382 RepID=A0AAI9TLK8_PENTH|nr:hypothetical protein VN97_g4351 [Penicillium thymicola]